MSNNTHEAERGDEEGAFLSEREQGIRRQGEQPELRQLAVDWLEKVGPQYSYHFDWLGRPIIQLPQDMVAMQEIIFKTRPDLIIETGIARGGSLVFSASILALLDYCDALETGDCSQLLNIKRKVLGVDVDIRQHNRAAIEKHPLNGRIDMIQGDSTSAQIVAEVKNYVDNATSVMVCLDSNHTHDHVLRELVAYAPFVTKGNYCVVFDTLIEDVSDDCIVDRHWGKGNSPKSAVWEFLESSNDFVADRSIDSKLLLSVAPEGYLKKVR